MTDHFLSYQNIDSIFTNPLKQIQDRVSSFYVPESQLVSTDRSKEFYGDVDQNLLKYKVVDQNLTLKQQEQKLVNKYIKNNINSHMNLNKFLSPRESPLKQRNRHQFMSPQIKYNGQQMPEDVNKGGFSVRQDFVVTQSQQNSTQNKSYSYQLGEMDHNKQNNKHVIQDYVIDQKMDDTHNQYGLKNYLSSNQLIENIEFEVENNLPTTNIYNENGINTQNQTGLTSVYSPNSDYSKNGVPENRSLNNAQRNLNTMYQAQNIKKEINNNQYETKNLEKQSDEEENGIEGNDTPSQTFVFSYQRQNSNNSNNEISSFAGQFPQQPVRTEKQNITGNFIPTSLNERHSTDPDFRYSHKQNLQNQMSQNSFQQQNSNISQNTPTNQGINGQFNRFTTKNIKQQFNDHRSMYDKQNLTFQNNFNNTVQHRQSIDATSPTLPLQGSLVNPLLQKENSNNHQQYDINSNNDYKNLNLLDSNNIFNTFQRSNNTKFLTYNDPGSSRNIEENNIQIYNNGKPNNLKNQPLNNNIYQQRNSLSKIDAFVSNQTNQTEKLRSLSPDNPIIGKLQKFNSQRIQQKAGDNKTQNQSTRAQTNQDVYHNIHQKFKTESDEQFSKFIQLDNYGLKNSGMFGSGSFSIGMKPKAALNSDRLNTVSSMNAFTAKEYNLKDSIDQKYIFDDYQNLQNKNNIYTNQDNLLKTMNSDVFRPSVDNSSNLERNQVHVEKYTGLTNDNQKKLKYGYSQEGSLHNSNSYNSENYKANDTVIAAVEQPKQNQHLFNSKKLSDRIQSFMFLCKENTSKIQDVFGLKKFASQYKSPNSQNNTQYQPVSSSNPLSQQNTFQPTKNINVGINSFKNPNPAPMPRAQTLQGLTNLASPLQRASSPGHHNSYSITPQHTNTISSQRVLSPNNSQRLGTQPNNSRIAQLSKFSDAMQSLGFQAQQTNMQQQQIQQQQNVQQNQFMNNQQVQLYQPQQQAYFVPNNLNYNQIYTPTSALNPHARLNSINQLQNIPQQKFAINNVNGYMNNMLGSQNGLQMNQNLEFQNPSLNYVPILLNQNQMGYSKKN